MSTQAERTVLGCVLSDNRVWREAASVITGEDFSSPHLGGVFDGLGREIAAGHRIDATTLEAYLPTWGIRGVGVEEPWTWTDAGFMGSQVYDAARVVRDAALRRRGREVFGGALERLSDSGQDPAETIEHAKRQLTETRGRSELEAVALTDVLATPDDGRWVIPGLLEERDRLILTGHEGLGKTTLVRQLLLLPAAGIHPFTGERIEPVRALVIDAENTARQWMRAAGWMARRALAVSHVDPAPNVHMALSGRLNLLDPGTLGGIHRLIDQHRPAILFIGPLYRLAVNLNTDADAAPVIAALDQLRDRGVALVIEAHAGHALGVGGVRDVRPRGSSALLGWPEFGLGIRKDVTDGAGPNVFDLVPWRGSRESRDWPHQLIRGNPALGDWPWVPRTGPTT